MAGEQVLVSEDLTQVVSGVRRRTRDVAVRVDELARVVREVSELPAKYPVQILEVDAALQLLGDVR